MNEPAKISSSQADWTREKITLGEWSPGKRLLRTIRDYQRHSARGTPLATFARKWAVVRHRFWSVICGADIPLNCTLGGGLLLPHPNGIVIHPGAVVGPNCLIFQQVTIGSRGGPGLPVIEGHVDIGAGAKILGGVRLGAHSVIGANSVVLSNVPPSTTAVGIPAKVLARARPIVAAQREEPHPGLRMAHGETNAKQDAENRS
jgi:serine O-acetyltransferase